MSSGVNYEAVKERIAAQTNGPVRATKAARPPNAYQPKKVLQIDDPEMGM